MFNTDDTIAAISSATGQAARMIVRMSGPSVRQIAENFIHDPAFEHASARRGEFEINSVAIPAWLYFFQAPRSATSQDLLEIHLPGNPLLARRVLDALLGAGARAAEPGEFTARAYFGGKLDLGAAESVADIISAQNDTELRAARQQTDSTLGALLKPLQDRLVELLALVETTIDFSEEPIQLPSGLGWTMEIEKLLLALNQILVGNDRCGHRRCLPRIVLCGWSNAGKSTLLNALIGRQRVLVSPQSGTTRDVITVELALKRGMVLISDTAGLTHPAAAEAIEGAMRRKALAALEEADVIVLLRDARDERLPPPLTRAPDLQVASKCDVGSGTHEGELALSALTGEGVERFREALDEKAFGILTPLSAAGVIGARHAAALRLAREALVRAKTAGDAHGSEILALELREALDQLGEIVGLISPDDVIGKIFARFCIGK